MGKNVQLWAASCELGGRPRAMPAVAAHRVTEMEQLSQVGYQEGRQAVWQLAILCIVCTHMHDWAAGQTMRSMHTRIT